MSQAGGFTLLEMMVALVIFSLIALAGAGILTDGVSSKERLDARQERLNDLALAHAILKADLIQLSRRAVRSGPGRGQRAGFTGGDLGRSQPVLRLVRHGWANPNAAETRSSLQTVEYQLVEGRLVRRAFDRLDPAEDTPSVERSVLGGVSELSLSFYGGGAWADQWFAGAGPRTGLPSLVALEMDLEDLGPVRLVFLTSEGAL